MAAGATYTPLATYTISTAQNSYTFTSIPNTYTDLVLVANLSCSPGYMTYRVGSSNTIDSGNNYSRTYLLGNGSTATSGRSTNVSEFYSNAAASSSKFAPTIMHFNNYANTSIYKTILSRSSDADSGVEAEAG